LHKGKTWGQWLPWKNWWSDSFWIIDCIISSPWCGALLRANPGVKVSHGRTGGATASGLAPAGS